jgi:hypothetical protein
LSKRAATLIYTGILFAADPSVAQVDDAQSALVEGARQQLTKPYMAAALPCSDPWLAGDDNRVVAVPSWAQTEGLKPGDVITAIGDRRVAPGEPDGWLHAMRALSNGLNSFDIVVNRAGRNINVRLSCRNHQPYFQAERRVWTSITRREWDECISAAVSAMRVFGRTTRPMIKSRCNARRLPGGIQIAAHDLCTSMRSRFSRKCPRSRLSSSRFPDRPC